MVYNHIRFDCGKNTVSINVEDLPHTFPDKFKDTTVVQVAYIHDGHAHILQVASDYAARESTEPIKAYYNMKAKSIGKQVTYEYGCDTCRSRFAFSIPESEAQKDSQCLHAPKIMEQYRPHQLWLAPRGRVRVVEHVDFLIRETDL